MPGKYQVKASHASWSFENVSLFLYIGKGVKSWYQYLNKILLHVY